MQLREEEKRMNPLTDEKLPLIDGVSKQSIRKKIFLRKDFQQTKKLLSFVHSHDNVKKRMNCYF